MKRHLKISTFVVAVCSLFSFSFRNHSVISTKAAIQAGNENWGLIGSFVDQINGHQLSWDLDEYDDVKFHYVANEEHALSYYELAYNFKAGDEFKIRLDNSWDNEIGYGGNEGGNIGTYLSNFNGNFKVKEDGTYLLKIKDDEVENYVDKSYGFSIEKITSATFLGGFISFMDDFDNIGGQVSERNISSIVITTDITKRPETWSYSCDLGESADQLTDDDKKVGAYINRSNSDSSMYDMVIYANVDWIFANAKSTGMFGYFENLISLEFDNFDTSRVTNMSSMFAHCQKLQNLDVTRFNTSNVTKMNSMFISCASLTRLDLSFFDTSKVTSMDLMFAHCNKLEALHMSSFDTSNVTNMELMFAYCKSLRYLDLFPFDTSNVTDMSNMFQNCNELVYLELSNNFTCENVIDMNSMFSQCYKLKSLDLTYFNPHQVTDMSSMFSDCLALENITFSHFDTSSVIDMNSMFANCQSLKSLDLSGFATSNVTNFASMFSYCKALESIDVSSFDTTCVENMSAMFAFCENLKEIKLYDEKENNLFVTDRVLDMNSMFAGCSSLTSLDVSLFDTSNVIDMGAMFAFSSLTSLDVSNFDTSNVVNMDYMFMYCSSLKNLDLSSFNTANVESMIAMFYQCQDLVSLDISSFDFSNIINEIETIDPSKIDPSAPEIEDPTFVITSGVGYLFDGANNLKYIETPSAFREDLSIDLPEQYAMVEGGVKEMDETTTNMTLVPGSLELNKLYNDLCALDTCKDYNQVSSLRDRYNALSDSDKALFATLSLIDQDKDGNPSNVLAGDKLAYMEHMFALNSVTEKTETHMMTSINDSSSFLVVTIGVSSLAILGYYLMQKRKYAR